MKARRFFFGWGVRGIEVWFLHRGFKRVGEWAWVGSPAVIPQGGKGGMCR